MTSPLSRCVVIAITASLFFQGASRVSAQLTPTSPKVRAMTDKAFKYLESPESRKAPQMMHIGGPTLLAYAIFKYGKRYKIDQTKHGRVLEALNMVLKFAANKKQLREEDNYNLGMCLIFLMEYDFENPVPKYTAQINALLTEFKRRQRADGAWSYMPAHATGDTSQTQYAVLALFTAKQFGYDVDNEQVARVCNWLLRTQDPSGSWGYQGQDPGIGNYTRISQAENLKGDGLDKRNFNKAHSDAAAGLGSLYITANMLQFTRQAGSKAKNAKKRGSLTAKQSALDSGTPLTKSVNGQMLLQRMASGDAWFNNNYSIPSERWQYYYLYTYERYQSFKELKEGREKQESAKWYTDGVNFLAGQQRNDGAWRSSKGGEAVDTSLAMLFLVRSTKIVIAEKLDSTFAGGRGLPDDTTNARMNGAKIVAPEVTSAIDEFKSILATIGDIDPASIKTFSEDIILTDAEKKRRIMQLKVRKLLSDKDPEKRMLAVKNLSRQPNALDHVPTLIYALSDPDPRIVIESRNALRFLSRKFNGVGLKDKFTPAQMKDAQEKWRAWYRSIRPDADLGFGF